MNIDLTEQEKEMLINTPEDGMGYHKVIIETNSGNSIEAIAINCEYIKSYELKRAEIKTIRPWQKRKN